MIILKSVPRISYLAPLSGIWSHAVQNNFATHLAFLNFFTQPLDHGDKFLLHTLFNIIIASVLGHIVTEQISLLKQR
jgi:hypothetical protein